MWISNGTIKLLPIAILDVPLVNYRAIVVHFKSTKEFKMKIGSNYILIFTNENGDYDKLLEYLKEKVFVITYISVNITTFKYYRYKSKII